MSIILGFERLINSGRIRGHRMGLVCNLASIDKNLQHISTRFANEPSVTLNALFGPQHGFESSDQDNMVETSHSHHSSYDIPIYSLYSETRTPTTDMLRDLDVLVIDLQDVGTRVYTYLYTMANCLRACRQHDIPVIVADRPNPIGGISVEGPLLDETYSSFVGQFAIPLRHGMTIGEVANLFNDHFGIGAKLEVFKMEGWTRQMYFDDTSLPWIPPSPNLPTLDSAIVYPGNVLIEGTNLSEGRGTTLPFELIGAPWINAEQLVTDLNAVDLPGVDFRPTTFEPTFQKHAQSVCHGCQIHVHDRTTFKPVLTTAALLLACQQANPNFFSWRKPPYEYEHVKLPIDILSGSAHLREHIEANAPLAKLETDWSADLSSFAPIREKFLIY